MILMELIKLAAIKLRKRQQITFNKGKPFQSKANYL